MEENAGVSKGQTDFSSLKLKKIGPFWVLILGQVKTKLPNQINVHQNVTLKVENTAAFILIDEESKYEIIVNDGGNISLKTVEDRSPSFQDADVERSEQSKHQWRNRNEIVQNKRDAITATGIENEPGSEIQYKTILTSETATLPNKQQSLDEADDNKVSEKIEKKVEKHSGQKHEKRTRVEERGNNTVGSNHEPPVNANQDNELKPEQTESEVQIDVSQLTDSKYDSNQTSTYQESKQYEESSPTAETHPSLDLVNRQCVNDENENGNDTQDLLKETSENEAKCSSTVNNTGSPKQEHFKATIHGSVSSEINNADESEDEPINQGGNSLRDVSKKEESENIKVPRCQPVEMQNVTSVMHSNEGDNDKVADMAAQQTQPQGTKEDQQSRADERLFKATVDIAPYNKGTRTTGDSTFKRDTSGPTTRSKSSGGSFVQQTTSMLNAAAGKAEDRTNLPDTCHKNTTNSGTALKLHEANRGTTSNTSFSSPRNKDFSKAKPVSTSANKDKTLDIKLSGGDTHIEWGATEASLPGHTGRKTSPDTTRDNRTQHKEYREYIHLDVMWRSIFERFDILKTLQASFQVKIKLNEYETKCEMIVSGTQHDVSNFVARFKQEFENKLVTRRVELNIQNTQNFIKTELTDLLVSYLEKERCNCLIVPRDRSGHFTLYAFDAKHVDSAVGMVNHIFHEVSLALPGSWEKNEGVNMLISKYNDKYKNVYLCVDRQAKALYITGVRDHVIKLKDEITTMLTQEYYGPFPDAIVNKTLLIDQHHDTFLVVSNDVFLDVLRKRYAIDIIPLTFDEHKKKGLYLSGTKERILKCEHEIREHLKNIIRRSFEHTDIQICEYFASVDGQVFIGKIQVEHSVLIQCRIVKKPQTEKVTIQTRPKDISVKIRVEEGSLNEIAADILVNTTSPSLELRSGAVSSAILRTAGQGIQRECSSKYPHGIKADEIAITGGYNLNCKRVFHGSIPQYSGGKESITNLRNFMERCLIKSTEMQAHTIAFPAIGTGNLCYPVAIVAKEMFDCVKMFTQGERQSSLKEVLFVIYTHVDSSGIKEFKKRLQDYTTRDDTKPVKWTKSAEEPAKTIFEIVGHKDNTEAAIMKLKSINVTKMNVDPIAKEELSQKDQQSYAYRKNNPSGTKVKQNDQRGVFVHSMHPALTIRVYQGDILDLPVDCIVNAANKMLGNTSGVARVIAQAAGTKLVSECSAHITQTGQLQTGSAIPTTAGGLKYNCIIHAVGPCWADYEPPTTQSIGHCRYDLKDTILNSLRVAEGIHMTSIAFPAISAATSRVPKEICSTEYANAIMEYNEGRHADQFIKEIHFVDKDPDVIKMIQSTFKLMIVEQSPCPYNFQVYVKTVTQGNVSGKNPLNTTPVTVTKSNDKAGSIYPLIRDTHGSMTCEFSEKHSIHIYTKDILKVKDVKVITCSENENGTGSGVVAKTLESLGKRPYTRVKIDAFKQKYHFGDIVITLGGQSGYKWVAHAIVPHRDHYKDESEWKDVMQLTFDNLFNVCANKCYTSMATALLGAGVGLSDPTQCAKIFLDRYIVACNRHSDKPLILHMVNIDPKNTSVVMDIFKSHIEKTHQVHGMSGGYVTSLARSTRESTSSLGTKSTFYRSMSDTGAAAPYSRIQTPDTSDKIQLKQACPSSVKVLGRITGDQPDGTMEIYKSSTRLTGFPRARSLAIVYSFHNGIQNSNHPKPGTWYNGMSLTAYLPDTDDGRKICSMLKVAFNRKLLFTFSASRTGQNNVIIWNEIQHKTSFKPNTQFGYPDPNYLTTVRDQLRTKGITEADIDHQFLTELSTLGVGQSTLT